MIDYEDLILQKQELIEIWDDDFADREQTPDDFCSYGVRLE